VQHKCSPTSGAIETFFVDRDQTRNLAIVGGLECSFP